MCTGINKEIAVANLRGEHDLANLLSEFELTCATDNTVHVDDLDENLKQGYKNLERRIRGTH